MLQVIWGKIQEAVSKSRRCVLRRAQKLYDVRAVQGGVPMTAQGDEGRCLISPASALYRIRFGQWRSGSHSTNAAAFQWRKRRSAAAIYRRCMSAVNGNGSSGKLAAMWPKVRREVL